MSEIFTLKVITPTREFYQGMVRMVELITSEGEIGIYAKHIPMTAIVVPGLLRIYETEGNIKMAALMSGFCEILENKMTILAEACEWPEEIDIARAKEAEKRAKRRLELGSSEVDIARAELALKRALVRTDSRLKR